MCILLHLEFLAGTDMVARNLVELAQFSHGSVVAFCYLRQGVTTLDGYVSSSALTLSASALAAPAACCRGAMAAAVVAVAAYLRLFLVYLYDRALEQQFVGFEVVDGVFLVDEGANER